MKSKPNAASSSPRQSASEGVGAACTALRLPACLSPCCSPSCWTRRIRLSLVRRCRRIIASLQGFDRYTWAVTSYTLASTTMIPIVGKLSDQFGRKWFLIVGTAIFLLGSVLSGASQTMNQFIAFRALQGCGAGIGTAPAFVVVADIFPPAERVRWQSLFGSSMALEIWLGQPWVVPQPTMVPLSEPWSLRRQRWRWVFYINLPLRIIVLAALLISLPATISARSNNFTGWAWPVRRIDVPGAVLSAAATVFSVAGTDLGQQCEPLRGVCRR